MSQEREKLVDEMIQMFGMEHEIVIDFIRLAETWNDTETFTGGLRLLVKYYKASLNIN